MINNILRPAVIFIAVALAISGCTGEKRNRTSDKTSGGIAPLVSLCRAIDYSDTAAMHSDTYMKKTMLRMARMISTTDSATTREALTVFFGGIKHDEKALNEAVRIGGMILNSPASPARDETLYIWMLTALLSTDSLPESARLRGEERLRKASLNRPGTIATDFRYLDRDGSKMSLHQYSYPQTLLIFYDPECPHCPEILTQIASNRGINRAIEDGNLGVLAIYAEGKRDVWDNTKAEMPGNWTVGYDLTGILDNDLYDLPAMPIIYLLDGEHRVLLKDPDPNALLE